MTDDLVDAARRGELPRVRALLAGAEPDPKSLDEALLYGVIRGHLEVARTLLDHGANPNRRHGSERTALFYAVTNGIAMLDLLLSRGADIHARDSIDFDVLHAYLVNVGPGLGSGADVAVVRRLLEAGLDVRARNRDAPHLPKACAAGGLASLELLLAAGADPNATTRDTSTLWEALKSRDTAGILAVLVRGGIDANTRCKNAAADTTILAEVCRVGDIASAQLLLDRGADPNAGAPLARAQENGNPALVDLLLERGAQPLTPSLSADATQALDVAEAAAKAHPEDVRARLAWADALLQNGFRAAAASEVAACTRRGLDVPAELRARLSFEAPAGVRWSFAEFEPMPDGVATRMDDARFPGARVTDGARTVPLVLTKGAPCASCDESGEVACSSCGGTGSFSSIYNDDPVDCPPRQSCPTCRGLKFAVNGKPLGKGSCRHPTIAEEMKLGDTAFRRCQACGLARLEVGSTKIVACGVCGLFVCSCARPG